MLKNEKSANRIQHQNRKNGSLLTQKPKNRSKRYPKPQNRKSQYPPPTMSASRNSIADSLAPPDFSVPWKCSDVVLVIERQKFHVHWYTLAMWSPVFEKMFMSEFKEKNSCEIPLPSKKASGIKELLLIIYPTISGKAWKTVTSENCCFLLKLADEYQIG